ncbi:MAG: hypothetical protein QM734_05980 [Cyclobacteriaceae bacterium]
MKTLKTSFLFVLLLFAVLSCTVNSAKPAMPKIATTDVNAVTEETASADVTITDDGGTDITARGVCWATSSSPTLSDNKTSDGTGMGNFVSSLSGLTPNTHYYLRAYAVNKIGVTYGNEASFITSPSPLIPLLTTSPISSITLTSAVSGGNVTMSVHSAVISRGVCWSTTSSPTKVNSKTTSGNGLGHFESLITNLSPGTKYYVRAWATNERGLTGYGNQIDFTTSASSVAITTTPAYKIKSSSAYSGGTIVADSSVVVIARGICWSSSPLPTTSNIKIENGTGAEETFTSYISSLLPYKVFYVRAYAITSAGTFYGNQITFKTSRSGLLPGV